MRIATTMIKVVSFDLDGTLITSDFDDYIWKEKMIQLYAEQHGISFEEATERVLEEYRRVPQSSIIWTDIKYWFNHFGFKQSWQEVFEEAKDRIKSYPEVNAVLTELKKKYKLIVITRAPREFIDIKLKSMGLSKYFDHIFSTTDFGRGVKGGSIFKRVCKIMNISPCEMIHVGDDADFDVSMPSSVGVRAILIDRKGDTDITDVRKLRINDLNGVMKCIAAIENIE